MTVIAKCAEDSEHQPEIHVELESGWYGDEDPLISFQLPDDCFPEPDYDGMGVFNIDLKDLLEDALSQHIANDLGESTHKMTKLLREYADKLDASAQEVADKWDSSSDEEWGAYQVLLDNNYITHMRKHEKKCKH